MRFITEFQLDNGSFLTSKQIEIRKGQHECSLGILIGNSFTWEENGETTLSKSASITHKYKLEIEAFPMDKWVEFRDKIRRFVVSGETDVTKIWLSILELESFGKPAGAAKEL